MHWRRRLQFAAVIVLVAAYAGLCHYSNFANSSGLGAALALTPVLIIGLSLLWRTRRLLFAVVALAVASLLYLCWPAFERHFSTLYVLQEAGFYTLTAFAFGQSLGAGRVALCTRLADKVHGPLSDQEVVYTRQVTAAWCVFFTLVTLLTLGLYAFAPLRAWSLFANFCVLPLVGLMFVAEYAVRRRRLPQTRRSGILTSVRTYFASAR
jgi:uncharacterized membrane protein